MSLKLKIYVEDQKKNAQTKLEARRAFLKEKGFSDEAVKKDVTTRKLKADVRKADFRLASIAAQEKQNQSLAQAKAEKKAAGKTKKEVKEQAPEKKEKKVKKEKPEKQAKTQGKKEKPEEKKDEPQAQ